MVHMEISSQAAESAVDARVECREQFRTSGTKMEIIKMTTGMLQWSYQWFAALNPSAEVEGQRDPVGHVAVV